MTDHERFRELSAGFVIGALDAEDRRSFEEHLVGCAECRSEVAAFAPLPGLLSRAGEVDAESLPAAVADRAAARAASEWRSMDHSRRRWRWAAGIAAVAAVVAATVALLPGPAGPRTVDLAVVAGPVTGVVAVESRAWGTAVHLDLEGLPQRDRYVAWVVDGEGNRQQAATWGPTPAGAAAVIGASSIPTGGVAQVVVTDSAGAETLLTATSG